MNGEIEETVLVYGSAILPVPCPRRIEGETKMGTELYEEISGLNPNYENYILTLLEGEGFGEKALISNREIAWMSDVDGFFS